MHRQSGRYLKTEYYLEIECLPDEELFSPTEIVRRKHNKNTNHESYSRMFHSIYQFGVRNGLTLLPDNGKRLPGGKLAMKDERRAKLRKGERSARWYGKTWKSKLYIEDREAIRFYAQTQLIDTLGLCLDQKRRELEVAKKSGRRIAMRKSLWVAALIAAIVFTAGSIYNYSYLNEGYSVLRSQGPRAAFEYFQNRGESYDNLFGLAWSAYRDGNYEEAEKTTQRVLRSPVMKDKARASYLLGNLKTISGEYDSAKEHFLTALAIYESTGNTQSLYKTQMVLSRVYLDQKDFENATYYLNLCESNESAWADEYFLFYKSQLAFWTGDFDAALSFSLKREGLVNEDQSRLPGIYSDIGLYYGFLGNLEKSLAYTDKAQNLARLQDNSLNLMHNNINMALYLKCSMQNYSQLRENILSYGRKTKDVQLIEMMYYVDKFTCPLNQGDPGHAPPPDDPPPGTMALPLFNGNPGTSTDTPQKRTDPGVPDPPDDPPPGDPGHPPPPSRTGNGHGDPPKDPPPNGGGN